MSVHTIGSARAARQDTPSALALERVVAMAQAMVAGLERDGVDTDEDELRLVLRDAGADVETLVVRLLRVADEAAAHMDALTARVVDLTARRARFSRRREACRATVAAIIEALPAVFPDARYRGAEYTASIRAGTPKPIVTDPTALPDDCTRVTRTPDMAVIRDWLRDGPVPGVTLSNAEPVLTVRSR